MVREQGFECLKALERCGMRSTNYNPQWNYLASGVSHEMQVHPSGGKRLQKLAPQH